MVGCNSNNRSAGRNEKLMLFKNKKPLITPPSLKKEDKVAIVAPARWVTEQEMQPAIEHLQSWGLQVMVDPQIYKRHHQFAGADEERTASFQQALDDDSIKAIFCARGGYGSVRLMSDLSFRHFLKSPKWVIGFSDITAFHSHLNYNVGVKTIHAPMPIHFKDFDLLKKSFEHLKKILFGESVECIFPSHPLNQGGEASGVITGGNLSVLYSLRGTPADIHPQGHILFLEDIDEYLYHIDRMMMNLKYGGVLKNLQGLLVGAFSEMKDNDTSFGKTAEEIIFDAVKEYKYPVAFGFPAGHVKENFPLVMGDSVCLHVQENCSLKSVRL